MKNIIFLITLTILTSCSSIIREETKQEDYIDIIFLEDISLSEQTQEEIDGVFVTAPGPEKGIIQGPTSEPQYSEIDKLLIMAMNKAEGR